VPLLFSKKEVFQWLKEGKKTIDIRKGKPRLGEFAIFSCGPQSLKFKVVKVESGRFLDLVRQDNFWLIIPSAISLEDAVSYLRGIYGDVEGVFTAYYVAPVN
jgi:ASC-1-like (ASCH) protein